MTSPFTARQAGLASIVAAGLILVSQVSQLVLPLTMPESFWIATQSLRMGLALLAMFALLLALTGLYARQVPGRRQARAGRLPGRHIWHNARRGRLVVRGIHRSGDPAGGPRAAHHRSKRVDPLGAGITSVTFAAGWVIFGLATSRAGIFPRGARGPADGRGCRGRSALIPRSRSRWPSRWDGWARGSTGRTVVRISLANSA